MGLNLSFNMISVARLKSATLNDVEFFRAEAQAGVGQWNPQRGIECDYHSSPRLSRIRDGLSNPANWPSNAVILPVADICWAQRDRSSLTPLRLEIRFRERIRHRAVPRESHGHGLA